MNKFNISLFVNGERVDLYENDSLVIDRKIQNIRDIEKVITDLSNTFVVPASKTNNKIFRHLLRLDTYTLDPRAYHEAVIKVNGQTYSEGYVQFEGGKGKSGVQNTYRLRFYGRLAQIARVFSDDILKDLPIHEHYSPDFNVNNWRSLFTSAVNNNPASRSADDDLRVCLNAFDDGYYYKSNVVARAADDNTFFRENSKNIYYSSTDATNNRNDHGIELLELKPSIKEDVILTAIEDRYNIRFSRGIDARGFPTNVNSEVVEDHFFNTHEFLSTYMLLHNKSVDTNPESLPENVLNFDNPWENTNAGGVFDTNPQTNQITLYQQPEGAGENSEYWVDFQVTRSGGAGAFRVFLRDEITGVDILDTGFINQNYNQLAHQNYESGTFSNYSGGTDNGDGRNYRGIRVSLENITQTERGFLSIARSTQVTRPAGWYIQNEDGVDVNVTATIWHRHVDGLGFFQNRIQNTKATTNTFTGSTAQPDFSVGDGLPKLKVIDWLKGKWRQNNLTAYVAKNAAGDDIIVTKTLDKYYGDGETLDITKYIDSQDYDVIVPQYVSPIIFKYQDPSTFLAKEFLNKSEGDRKYGYGSLSHDLIRSTDFSQRLPYKEYKIELPFEQVVLSVLQDEDTTNTNDLDIAFGWFVNESRNPTQTKPWQHFIERVAVGSTDGILVKEGGTVNTQVTACNLPTKVLRVNDEIVQTLTFGVENDERTAFLGQTQLSSTETLFSNRYENYINQVFDPRSVVRVYNFRLPAGLINRVIPSTTLVISNKAYRISYIKGDLNTGKGTLEVYSIDNNLVSDTFGVRRIDAVVNILIDTFVTNIVNGVALRSIPTTFVTTVLNGTNPTFELVKNNTVLDTNNTGSFATLDFDVNDSFFVRITQGLTSIDTQTITITSIEDGRVILDHNNDPITDHLNDPIIDTDL